MLKTGSNSIQLWLVHESKITDQSLLDQYHGLLSERELKRYERLRLASDKKQFLITQVLARSVLAELTGINNPGAIRFERNSHGKPYLPGQDQPQFNLTNSNGLIALAVAVKAEIGIDVEYLHRKAACLQLARRYFTKGEAETFEGLDESALRDRFFDYWTLKEAWLKAFGTGLRTPLNYFGFTLSDKVEICFTSKIQSLPQEWAFWQFDLLGDYRLSVCLNDAPDREYQITAQEGVPLKGFRSVSLQQRRPY